MTLRRPRGPPGGRRRATSSIVNSSTSSSARISSSVARNVSPFVPERLDTVAVAYSRGVVEIPWDSRDQLLAEIRHLDSAQPTIAAFEAVGASRPVTLDNDQASLVIQAIDVWMRNVGGPDKLPGGIFALRNALIDQLHDAGLGA
jgi:hypothetical protein